MCRERYHTQLNVCMREGAKLSAMQSRSVLPGLYGYSETEITSA